MAEAPRWARWILSLPTLISTAIAAASFASIQFVYPVTAWSQLFISGRTDSLPQWWASTLYAIAIAACVLRGAREWTTNGRISRRAATRGRPWTARSWWGLAVLLLVLSVDHVLRVHAALEDVDAGGGMLNAVAHRPVQALLVLGGAPVALLLLATSTPTQRRLLVLAGLVYSTSAALLDGRLLAPAWSYARLETLEATMEWAGLQLLVVAAVWGVPWRSPWTRGDGESTEALRQQEVSKAPACDLSRIDITLPDGPGHPLGSDRHRPAAARDRPSRASNDRRRP